MDMLSNVMWLHPKIIRNPKVVSPIFADLWSKKMRSPNFSARGPLTRDLSGLGFVELLERACLHHVLVEIMHLPRNVQVSCPLLERRGGHVVVFQVKVPQISLVRQFIYDATKSFTVWISAQNRDFF